MYLPHADLYILHPPTLLLGVVTVELRTQRRHRTGAFVIETETPEENMRDTH